MILSSLTPKSSFIVGLIISSPLVSPSLYKTSQQNVNNVLMATFSEQDILDTSIEEVEWAIHHLIRNRAGGPDMISPEHLKFSGPVFRNWHISQLECIPQCFKHGIIIPAYKGKGRDPLSRRATEI